MSRLTWPLRLLGFMPWFVKEVVVANVAVLRDNLTPGQDSEPGIARFVTRCRSDLEITALASVITLTPGTLTIGTQRVSRQSGAELSPSGDHEEEGTRVLFVHGMYTDDADALRAELRRLEDHVLGALRPGGVSR